jgi:hypothetical protein
MRKHLSIALFAGILITSCDVIEGPYKEVLTGGAAEFCANDSIVIRKTFLEDYTGQGCNNCPEAAETAETLKAIYGDCLVVMAIHTGFFARPTPETLADYRTDIADAWDAFFEISAIGLPQGMINRTGFNTEHVQPIGSWPTLVSEQIALPPDAKLELEGIYNSSSLSLSVDVGTEFISSYSGTTQLGVYLLESGIISPQKWQNPDGDVVIIEDYEHNHMLRASFNGVWGDTLNTTVTSPGLSFDNHYEMIVDTSIYNPENLSLVAILYDSSTKEVLQAESAHIE